MALAEQMIARIQTPKTSVRTLNYHNLLPFKDFYPIDGAENYR